MLHVLNEKTAYNLFLLKLLNVNLPKCKINIICTSKCNCRFYIIALKVSMVFYFVKA